MIPDFTGFINQIALHIEQMTIIFVLKGESKRMAELKLISKHSDSLKQIIQSALSEKLHSIKTGIKRTEEHLQQFETKYTALCARITDNKNRGKINL